MQYFKCYYIVVSYCESGRQLYISCFKQVLSETPVTRHFVAHSIFISLNYYAIN